MNNCYIYYNVTSIMLHLTFTIIAKLYSDINDIKAELEAASGVAIQ